MRKELKEKSFKCGEKESMEDQQHSKMSSPNKLRFKSNSQKQITLNKISKKINVN